jgi:isoleucyl-tRNA synthetase
METVDMSDALRKAWQKLPSGVQEKGLALAIWTTTAWSLPGNTVSV